MSDAAIVQMAGRQPTAQQLEKTTTTRILTLLTAQP